MNRREVLSGEVSIPASPVHVQANASPDQMQANASPDQMQANESPVQLQAIASPDQMQANGSPDQMQANASPVQIQAIQNLQNWQNTSKGNVKENAKENVKENARENANAGKCESSISSYIKRKSNDICSEIVNKWNESLRNIIFGSFHQNNERFSKQSRGFQCTSNALCMLVYSASLDINDGLILDKILCEGDSLYMNIVSKLKNDGKFIQPLLSLDEIPDEIEIEKGKFIVDKQPIVSGILVDSFDVDHGLPSLHCVLQSAFASASSGLLIIGAICSAVVKKDDLYIFFDSHCHGKNGLSSSEGTSVLMYFKSLDDLVSYLYAFYDSLKIDISLQFDFLPLTIKSYQQETRCKIGVEHQLEAYFKDQKMRQAMKEKYVSKSATCKKKKKRTQYNRLYKRQQREHCAFREKEKSSQKAFKQNARKNPTFKTKETGYQLASKQSARKDPVFKIKEAEYQRASKQSARKNHTFKIKEAEYQLASKQNIRLKPGVMEKERLSKQRVRKDPTFKTKEAEYQLASKRNIRLKPGVMEKEKLSKQRVRQDTNFKVKEIQYQRASKQSARKDPSFKTKEAKYQLASKQNIRLQQGVLEKERLSKQRVRQDTNFKVKEREYQLTSKRNIRLKPGVLEKEKLSKRVVRKDVDFKIKETQYQRASKQNARKKPIVLEQERIKKQQIRQLKRQTNEVNKPVVPTKQRKLNDDASHDRGSSETVSRKAFKDINECIKDFHSSIAIGPIYVCTCCHQTWFRKSVSMTKNINISAKDMRLYWTKLLSVNKEEWVCHTCLSSIRDGKVPKLSVANGMKWSEKPKELHLHQLEERLIALRIPFMQIRELPRGGQYSLKGNVINVPVDIQPTVSCLPRPMDENFTVAIQLKKKLTYKKVDFKENVRPLKVLTALQWLLNNSDLYKNSGINVANNWFQQVTESSDENVREFLEMSDEHSKSLNDAECQTHEQNRNENILVEKDMTETGNESDDGYSEIDANEQVGNVDTLVDDANIESKYDKVYTFAPGEGQHPLSLYHDKDAEYLCFPSIFCGQKPLSNDQRSVPVHYSDIVKWELRSVDRRAAQSVPNIFFKHKKLQMKQISDKVNLAIRRCKNRGKKITAAEARNPAYLDKLVNLDEGYYIFRQLRNSPPYLEARKKDIFAMIRQLSLPTWFISLSAADTRWTDLLKMLAKLNNDEELTNTDIENMTWQEKTKLVQKDPVTCSRYFDHRVNEFLSTVLKSNCEPIGKVKDYFYRVEFQQRGSPHIHMLVWVENAPTLETNSEDEIVQFVDQYLTCSAEKNETLELVKLQTHKHSRTCRKKGKPICRFGFSLPPLPRTMLLYPLEEEVEKYKKKSAGLQKDMNEFQDNVEMTFDDFLNKIARMDFEDYIKCIRSSLRAPKVFLKRKPQEMRINLFNENMLLAWKANLDIQIVLEPYGCATYIVGYISKSQRGMSSQLDAAAKEARKGNLDLKKQVRHIGNVFSNCVEVSAQEAVYLSLQIPLTKSTRDVVFVNTSTSEERVFLLKPKSSLDDLPPESTDIESDNIIQRYSKRPRQLQKLCLADYVSKVDVIYPKENKVLTEIEVKNDDDVSENSSSDESIDTQEGANIGDDPLSSDFLFKAKTGTVYKRRKVPKVIRYVRYNKKKDPENYFREKLMLFMPWRNEAKDLLGTFDTYEAHYNSMKTSLEAKGNEYEHHVDELEIARQTAEAEENSFDEIAPNTEQENREAEEEGDTEAENFVYFNPNRVLEHRHYDIGIELQSTCSVPPVETTGIMLPDEEYLQLLRSLNARQREFFNHIVHWIKCKDEPVYAFLSGGAGVGKSVVIRALYQSLYRTLNLKEGENPDDIRILLCAYMGFAAFNISGQTICSAFHKKIFQGSDHMSADELNTFRIKYRHLKVIIIDEISTVSSQTLSFINTRLQQLTGTTADFGGLSVIAVGDLYQLKPVTGSWIFLDLDKESSSLARNLWKDLFKLYELVDIMRQKDDLQFAHLLNRLRLNELTDKDQDTLQTRLISPESKDYQKDVLHLFAENAGVDKHNNEILIEMPGEKVVIACHDTVVSANISAKKCDDLVKSLPDDFSKTGNLMKLLTVAVGMIYVMTVNVDVEDGLTNGSTGIVKLIEYRMKETNRPSIIWVLFDHSRIGKSTREKFYNRGFYNANIQRDWTPVFDVERTFIYNYKTYQRIQFPLKPAAAKTVHNAQGATVDKVVVDLSQKKTRKVPHIHYVALSRVKKLDDLYILNLNQAAYALDERVTSEMQRLRTEAALELCYVPLYKIDPCKIKTAFNNARSLHKHLKDIEAEPNVLAADVIGFAETRLCQRDEDTDFTLKGFALIRLDETGSPESVHRPHHGLALYIKTCFEVKKLVKLCCSSFEFIAASLVSGQKGYFQVAILYKYPKSSQSTFKKDISCHLRPLIDLKAKFVLLGDFNISVDSSHCIDFIERLFNCKQHIQQSTHYSGSVLDLVFSNCNGFCDIIDAYWTDHKLVYCAIES